MNMETDDLQQLRAARQLLENPGFAAKVTNYVGLPIEKGFELLPANWSSKVNELTRGALTRATDAAIATMKDSPGAAASTRWHKMGAALTGGVGGFLGLAALAAELPLSTTIMLRSIADVARSEGESIADPDTRMACLEVFALGGKNKGDDGAETGYFAVRSALARSVAEAAQYIGGQGASQQAAPALVKLIAKIAERFGVQVTQKAAAQAVPAIGAAGGAIINGLFIDHFQDMARGHFIIRRLERKYGAEEVRRQYETLPGSG